MGYVNIESETKYYAVCSCGWRDGPWVDNFAAAQDVAADHERTHDRTSPEDEPVDDFDLVAALRASIEAARARRAAASDQS